MYPGRIDISTFDDIQVGFSIVIVYFINDVGDTYQSSGLLYLLVIGFWFQGSFVDRFSVALLVSSLVFRLRFLFAVTD